MHNHLILFVDDDNDFRRMLSLKLKSAGFDIVEAENGKIALEKLGGINPDLVILDFQMSAMNGISVLNEIKSHEKFSKVKVVFLTNYGEANEEFHGADKKAAFELGAIDYIRKTDDFNNIIAKIESAIHG